MDSIEKSARAKNLAPQYGAQNALAIDNTKGNVRSKKIMT
jgi:hypothetical protein